MIAGDNDEWLDGSSADDWLAGLAHERGPRTVRDVVPVSFPRYARLLHPVFVDGRERRWGDLAIRAGISPSAQLQLPDIMPTVPGDDGTRQWAPGWSSNLPRLYWHELGPILRRHTNADAVALAIWSGRGNLPATPAPPATVGEREYFLLRLPLSQWHESKAVGRYQPTMVWPLDQSWFMGGDLELASTYLAGTEVLVDEVLARADIEAFEAQLDDLVVTI